MYFFLFYETLIIIVIKNYISIAITDALLQRIVENIKYLTRTSKQNAFYSPQVYIKEMQCITNYTYIAGRLEPMKVTTYIDSIINQQLTSKCYMTICKNKKIYFIKCFPMSYLSVVFLKTHEWVLEIFYALAAAMLFKGHKKRNWIGSCLGKKYGFYVNR